MITKLTPEQQAQLEVYAKKWRDIGLSTEPANRPEAEKGVTLAYELAGLDPPKEYVWFESPYAMYQHINEQDTPLTRGIRHDIWRASRGKMYAKVHKQLSDALIIYELALNRYREVIMFVRAALEDALKAEFPTINGMIYRHERPWWLIEVEFYRDVWNVDDGIDLVAGLMIIAQTAGCWIPYKDTCYLAENHTILTVDEQGRLHGEDAPAIGYPDGWGVYRWHEVSVPEYVIMRPHEITPEKILKEENTEIARIMLERYGQDNFIRDGGFSKVQSDDYGELYRVDFPHDEPIVAVKVKDASTDREYFLYVPPYIWTAHAGVAWTFGYDNVSDYNPDKET